MVNRLCEGRLYGAAGRLTAQSGGARPGQDPEEQDRLDRLYHAERSLEQGAITGAQDRASHNFMGLASLGLDIGIFCGFL
jgi:hypothetical protein